MPKNIIFEILSWLLAKKKHFLQILLFWYKCSIFHDISCSNQDTINLERSVTITKFRDTILFDMATLSGCMEASLPFAIFFFGIITLTYDMLLTNFYDYQNKFADQTDRHWIVGSSNLQKISESSNVWHCRFCWCCWCLWYTISVIVN